MSLGRKWRYKVFFPPDYYSLKENIPVVYLLHGSGGDENSWDPIYPVLDDLIVSGEIPHLMTIAPSSGTSYWIDGKEPYETAFINDLIPYVDNKYLTRPGRMGRGIAGFSMGGYGALRYSLVYPDLFSAGTLLSPAIYDQTPPLESSARTSGVFGTPFDNERWETLNYPRIIKKYLAQEKRVPLYIAVGDDDYNFAPDIEYNIELQVVKLYGRLYKMGGSPAELRILAGGHNWKLWKPTFVRGLKYMLKFIK